MHFTFDSETVAGSINTAFVGVVDAADVPRATANTTLNGAHAEGYSAVGTYQLWSYEVV